MDGCDVPLDNLNRGSLLINMGHESVDSGQMDLNEKTDSNILADSVQIVTIFVCLIFLLMCFSVE